MKIVFAGSNETNKRWTGTPVEWPPGVYESCFGTIIIVQADPVEWVSIFNTDGTVRPNPDKTKWAEIDGVRRVCNDPQISGITFAGSMNYPDGKPEGGAQ